MRTSHFVAQSTDIPTIPYELSIRTPPVVALRRAVNHDVMGGGAALFLVDYGASIAFGLVTGVASCSSVGGVSLWLVPLSSVAGGVCGWIPGVVGLVLGLGQVVGIVLMVAGATVFRRNVPVTFATEGITVSF